MNRNIFFAILCLLSCLTTSAQDKTGNLFHDKIMLEMGFEAETKQHDIFPIGINVNIGYKFTSRLYAYGRYQGIVGLYDDSNFNTYTKTQNIGGGIGYIFHKEKHNAKTDLWSIRAQMTGSIGNPDWRNTTYDIGIFWQSKYGCSRLSPILGLGFRHTNSHTQGIKNHNGIYASIGWGI